jgi:hypothetical protein
MIAALVIVRFLFENSTRRLSRRKEVRQMANLNHKESGIRLNTKAVLETLWTIGCGIVVTGAVPS